MSRRRATSAGFSGELQALREVAPDVARLQLLAAERDMAVGTNQEVRHRRDVRIGKRSLVVGIVRHAVHLEQLVRAADLLAERDEMETQVVQALEGVLDRAAGRESELEPRKAVARTWRPAGPGAADLRKRAVSVVD